MKTFLHPLQNLAEMEAIYTKAKSNRGILEISGCMESQKAHLIYGLSGLFPYHLILGADEKEAKELFEDYRFYDKNTCYYPARDLLFFQADIHGNLLIRQRMQVIRALLERVVKVLTFQVFGEVVVSGLFCYLLSSPVLFIDGQ